MISGFQISDEDFRALRDLIRERFGIYYDDQKQFLLLSRLQTRLAKRSLQTYGDYVKFLRFGLDREAEFTDLASVLSNNETYFFRERAQLKSLCGPVMTELQAVSPRLRIWSAACSSGEEPYSLAMSLLESGRIAEPHISITATDISPRVLELCERGYYRALSFRATEPEMVRKYFTPLGDGFQISERIKRMVRFGSLNLMDDAKVARNGPFDAIFCRNVLIYFDKPTQKRVVESFAKALRPGGYLFLGHAESLFHLTECYEPIVQPESIVYRVRPAAAPALTSFVPARVAGGRA
ncbi:MAG: protein-glutamate O-methyltransferase CheR [Candidatus Velthaea sp.]